MLDKDTYVSEIRARIDGFCNRRKWNDGNGADAKNIAIALSVEASELFQWKSSDDDISKAEIIHIKEEVADVFWYLMRICACLDIDLCEAVCDKETKNSLKYPE